MGRYHPTKILPFPAGIDRQHFGSYLSGLTDGEGNFALHYRKGKSRYRDFCHVSFNIVLRADDRPLLELIQSFLGCGTLNPVRRSDPGRTNPAWKFSVQKASDLARIVVPHFLRHPLFAKKKRDFEIWQEGIALAYLVCKRPRHNGGRGARGCGGGFPKWTEEERCRFKTLCDAIMKQRVYEADRIHLPPPPPEQPTLFDGLP